MQIIKNIDDILSLIGNQIIGDFEMTNSSVIFNGNGNLLYAPKREEKCHLLNSTITFNANNALIFLVPYKGVYSLSVAISNDSYLHFGKPLFLNGLLNCQLVEMESLFIGNDNMHSYGISIVTSDYHFIYDTETHKRLNHSKSIFIGDHVWLGEGVKIRKGTQIGSGSIVGAFSVVSGKTIPSNTVWIGNPAQQKKSGCFWLGDSNRDFTVKKQREWDRKEINKYTFSYSVNETTNFSTIERDISYLGSPMEKAKYFECLNMNKNRFFIDGETSAKPKEQKSSSDILADKFNFAITLYPLPQFLYALGFKKVAFLVSENTRVDLSLIHLQMIRDKRVEFVGFFSNNDFVIPNPSAYHLMPSYGVKKFNIEFLPENTLMIDLVATTWSQSCSNVYRQKNCFYWVLGTKLLEFYNIATYSLQPFFHFANKHPNVPVIMYERPIFPPENNRTEFEKNIVKNKVTIKSTREALRKGEECPVAHEYFDYTNEEIIAVCDFVESYKDSNGIRRFKDFHEGRVNYIDGHRVTSFQPKEYDRTVFIVSSCVNLVCQIDEHTVASWLQRKLNDSASKIKVENYAYCVVLRYEDLIDILYNIPVKDNDIVILETNFSNCSEPRVFDKIVLHTGKIFYDKHKYGEVFFDCDGLGHYNANGARELADVLFEHLYNNEFFCNANNFDIYKGLIPQDIAPIKQLGTPLFTTENRMANTELEKYIKTIRTLVPKIGSIVMNCNPFTLGHRYLIEESAKKVANLIIFVVEEDKSEFPFNDRIELVRKGVSDLSNVTVVPSGRYIISNLTFVDYLNKSELREKKIDLSHDVEIFARDIAPSLGITVRFCGEEPLDNVTFQYNQTMSRILPKYGIDFKVIPRKKDGNTVISASRVRALLKEQNFDEIARIVPPTTLEYLKTKWQ